MILRNSINRIGNTIADDFGKGWAIGVWFVVPFAVVGYIAQLVWGVPFGNALLLGLPVGLLALSGRVINMLRSISSSAATEDAESPSTITERGSSLGSEIERAPEYPLKARNQGRLNPEGNQPERDKISGRSSAPTWEALAFIWVALWVYKSWLKRFSFQNAFPPLLIMLIAVQLIDVTTHLFGRVTVNTSNVVLLAGLFLLAAALMVLHYRRHQRRVARHKAVLESLHAILRKYGDSETLQKDPAGAVHRLLEAVVSALAHHREHYFSAMLAIRQPEDEIFSVAFQEPIGIFGPGHEAMVTAISKVEAQPPGTLVYVPNTSFEHGVAIETHGQFSTSRIIPNMFPRADFGRRGSLLCVHVPNENFSVIAPTSGEVQSAVFCIAGSDVNSMDALDFNTTKLVAYLLALVLGAPGQKQIAGVERQTIDRVPEQLRAAAAAAGSSPVFHPSGLVFAFRTAWEIFLTGQKAESVIRQKQKPIEAR